MCDRLQELAVTLEVSVLTEFAVDVCALAWLQTELRPNMARSVKVRKTKVATIELIRAIAVAGRSSRGLSCWNRKKKIPRHIVMRKRG